MPPISYKGMVFVGTKKNPYWWRPTVDSPSKATEPRAPWAEPWTPSPLAAAAMDFAAKEPEMAVTLVAFLVGLLCPCRGRVCEKVIVACCDHRAERAKRENAAKSATVTPARREKR